MTTPKVIIEVRGGCVCAVHCDHPIEVRLCDWDSAALDEDTKATCEELEKRARFMEEYFT